MSPPIGSPEHRLIFKNLMTGHSGAVFKVFKNCLKWLATDVFDRLLLDNFTAVVGNCFILVNILVYCYFYILVVFIYVCGTVVLLPPWMDMVWKDGLYIYFVCVCMVQKGKSHCQWKTL